MVLVIVILGIAVAVAFLVLLQAARRRMSIYRYDVRADHSHDFSHSSLGAITLPLRNGHLEVPPPAHQGAHALLELRIGPTGAGRWFEPCIVLESARGRRRQPFERGGSGRRYVELTQLVLEGTTSLRLMGHFLRLPDQSVVVHYLRHNVGLERQRILVLGTHPDDAEIAAFGLYADRDAYVVTVTAGEGGEPGAFERFGGSRAYFEKGRHRAWNSVTVPMLGGLAPERTANLGYFDGTLPAMRASPGTPVQSLHAEVQFLDAFGQCQDPTLIESRRHRSATWRNLVGDLQHLVEAVRPDILVTPYPRLDWHPDHQMTTVALIEALKNLNWRHGLLWLYTNHASSSDRYPFGGAGDLVSLPGGIDDLFFENAVSIPLDAATQARKYMALDAMVDLRSSTQIDVPRSLVAAAYKVLKSTLTDGSISYFRQAVRANELYFEVAVSRLFEPGVTEKIVG